MYMRGWACATQALIRRGARCRLVSVVVLCKSVVGWVEDVRQGG